MLFFCKDKLMKQGLKIFIVLTGVFLMQGQKIFLEG